MDCGLSNVISWNVRERQISCLGCTVRSWYENINQLFLFWWKLILGLKLKDFWGRLGYYPVVIVDVVGHKGEKWFLSANLKFSCKILWAMNQRVTLEIDGGGRRWICSAVYGSPQAANRVYL
ncbi:hypothetical protein S245_040179 [Arachis hypogaea]